MMLWYSLTVAFLVFTLCQQSCVGKKGTKTLPSTFPRCKRNDPDLTSCIQNAMDVAIHALKNGNSDLGILPLDPLEVTKIHIEDGAGRPVNLKLSLNNVKLTGLSTFDISSVRVDLDKRYLEVIGNIPNVVIEGDYTMDGKFLVLPMKGNGRCIMKLTGMQTKVTLQAKELVKNGKKHWDVENLVLHTENLKNFHVHFDNLFNGDKELGENTNRVLNDNWKELFEELRGTLGETFGSVFKSVSNLIFHKVPESDIFLES